MVRMRLVTSELKNVGHQVGSRDTQASRAHIEKAHLLPVVAVETTITQVKHFTEYVTNFFDRKAIFDWNLENESFRTH